MIRLAYYEHPDYVPLLRRAYELWDELEKSSGQKLLYLTGGIYMGPPEGEVVGGALKAARMHDFSLGFDSNSGTPHGRWAGGSSPALAILFVDEI